MAKAIAMKGPDPKKKGLSVNISATRGATKKTFIPGDMQGKHIIDRKTTHEHGRAMGEHPAKTQTRINAQAGGSTSYSHKGKSEYSGRHEHSSKPEFSATISGKPHIPKMKSSVTVIPKKKTSSGSGSGQMKRRLPRVDYLQGHGHGRNKRTESGFGK
jgi:hypothetical protein